MMRGPDPSAAPAFMGPTPPDAVAMTMGEHLDAALGQLQSTNLSDDDMRALKVFFVSVQQVIQQKLQEQGGQLLPEEETNPIPEGAANEAEGAGSEDYGTGFGTPIQLGM